MTTVAQVRHLLKPLLSRHSDLALVGRFLIIKPVRHIMRGVFVDRCGDPNEFVPTKVVDILFRSRRMFTLGWGGRVKNSTFRTWDIANLEAIGVMTQMIEHEVLPELRAITSFDDFAAFASIKRPMENSLETDVFTRMLLAVAEGNFEEARNLWRNDPATFPATAAKSPLFYTALCQEDRAELARIMHQWEAQTIATFKLEKVWEPTPFPLEVIEDPPVRPPPGPG